MSVLNYKVIISTTEPTGITQYGTIWINPNISEARFKGNDWILFSTDNPISSYTTGTFYKWLISQGTEPSKDIGQLWLNTATNQLYICLNNWIVYFGA